MAEIFGAVVAGMTVGSHIIELGRAIQKIAKTMKNSRKDIKKLATETIIFAGLYKRFLRACDQDNQANTGDESAIDALISWAKQTVDSLKDLLKEVEALLPKSKIRFDWEEKVIARLVWLNSTEKVRGLRASLSVARESINGFSNLMCLKALKDELVMLKSALNNPVERGRLERRFRVSLDAKIQELELDISDTEIVHFENIALLEEKKQEVSRLQQKSKAMNDIPAAHEMTELTEALKDYARELLPPRASSRRTKSGADNSPAASETPTESSRPAATSSTDSHTFLDWIRRDHDSTDEASTTSSITSDGSSQPSFIKPKSVSNVSSVSKRVTRPQLSHIKLATVGSTTGIENKHSSTRAGEYINNPAGTILSPPMLKVTGAPEPTLLTRVGRHTITLRATSLTLNNNSLHINNHQHGLQLYQTLLDYPNKLDSLDEALCQRIEDWDGIPGWIVYPSEATAQAAVSGFRDV